MPRQSLKLQRRHFQFIADLIKDARIRQTDLPLFEVDGIDPKWMADLAADRCRATNPGFDRGRFLRACGIDV